MAFRDANTAAPEKDRHLGAWHAREQQLNGEDIAEMVRVTLGHVANPKRRCNLRCHFPLALRAVDSPVQKKYRSLERGPPSNALTTASGKTQ